MAWTAVVTSVRLGYPRASFEDVEHTSSTLILYYI